MFDQNFDRTCNVFQIGISFRETLFLDFSLIIVRNSKKLKNNFRNRQLSRHFHNPKIIGHKFVQIIKIKKNRHQSKLLIKLRSIRPEIN